MIHSFLCAETIVFHRGETVRLPCNTSSRNYVQWDYRSHLADNAIGIYENGLLDESYRRLAVDYPLIIRNAVAEDQGYYTCVENAGSGSVSSAYHLKYEGTVLIIIIIIIIIIIHDVLLPALHTCPGMHYKEG